MRLTAMLIEGKAITTEFIRERFGVSKATAKRDMNTLETVFPVKHETLDGNRGQLSMGAD